MCELSIKVRNSIIGLFYRRFLKPVFFRIDPEAIHDVMLLVGCCLGAMSFTRKLTAGFFAYSNKNLEQEILGIRFKNPVGLAAGFDKDGVLTDILPSVGFGFEEIGSVTGEPCEGNPKPRLWRLPKSRGLVVYYGLKNQGCEEIARRLRGRHFKIPIGASIAKTNCPRTAEQAEGIKDYVKAYSVMQDIGDYMTINISCPNAFGGQPFTRARDLEKLLAAIGEIRNKKPVFLKLPPDLSRKETDSILEVAAARRIEGFICTNLTKDRENAAINAKIHDEHVPKLGGISGKPVLDLADAMIRYVHQKTRGRKIIIGCGGVFSAQDAYKKIRLGASLIQLITGMIFEGPQVISEINAGLARLLKEDGFKNISEAVGADNK